MKCEICHNAPAETAIQRRQADGEEEELYVCKACADAERREQQQRSQRTRKTKGLPPGMSITMSGDVQDAPPIIGAILDAVHGMVCDLEKASKAAEAKSEEQWLELSADTLPNNCRINGHLHLEALHLIGELEPVQRAARALELDLAGLDVDGVKAAGHAFTLRYRAGAEERARRVQAEIAAQECNARRRLLKELPRVFGDALCRALAILKNCRLLAPGEFFDLLSPLRLATMERLLDGIDRKEIEALLAQVDLSGEDEKLSPDERDRVDADRADRANLRFEPVMLNERAQEHLL